MTDQNKQTASNAISVNAQYIKDISFENPRAPFPFMQQEQPAINLDLEINVNILEKNTYEVILKIEADAKVEDQNLFLVELQYAGVFTIDEGNMDQAQKELILSVNCPNIIFPYARRILSDITRDGGYPPLMISPIDFLGLYLQRKSQDSDSTDKTIN
ncbi:MAG: protein-export chaperone SecB [Candidatus Midichloria mitochondrii]|uniref:Protein-export protein SecB n=1 Tax=Midichloria mitochondrii (strain IricVA) TaxID=696127 RepID=F7XVH8_MIDMI|nr:protein-export chaperone SecB [Candidatus Midichloria mitochondrii]AEI88677.1 protein-export protein SecB [Candidatus Midichloria mitochondrii IricVA]MDJ1256809.1 protein-export chaperone SecB [Candidatus Midichloria mitochondrii]MDJ1288542.1 protein-export chaperone SecB [Candidatus Midichloria mitochondrii]MDJ1299375.1 protein-export chaperone SecB [Candidatus Midichloria mitochondrii]MDJ1313517.1 protein-export chaperone SecB [Candidatus Midichloria mitochondrii]